MTTGTWTRARLAAAGLAAVVLLAAGCGDDNNSGNDNSSAGGTTTTTTEAASGSGSGPVCDDLDQLKSSVSKLGQIDTSENVGESLSNTIDDIGKDLSNLADSAGDEVKPEIDQLKSSLSELKSAVADLGTNGGVRAAANALQDVLTDAGAVADKLASTDCKQSGS
ncbi:MAG TPA: hypothetical protein VKB57_14675 [Acidimicrobiales bacterium]|nr:hypothetical protein [Acidimicrobiales bacterium]